MEGREIRILVEFEHDEPDPSFRVLAAEALPLVGEVASQLVFGRPLGSGCLIGARDGWANLLADHLAKEFFLAAEVEVGGCVGDAGARRGESGRAAPLGAVSIADRVKRRASLPYI